MAQLHEHQGKQLLAAQGVAIPAGRPARSAAEARAVAAEIGGAVVVKAQIHSTSRAAQGGVKFADTPDEAANLAAGIFRLKFSGATPEAVLIEEKQSIAREFYLGYIIDDRLKRPCLLFSAAGGSGIEERAATMARVVCSVRCEPTPEELTPVLQQADAPPELLDELSATLVRLYRAARACEARTAEINPLAELSDGRLVALDSRVSVDDYATFRHPELGVEIARELGHTPTKLERIAWDIERDDFRGTFFFVEIQPTAGGRQQTAGGDSPLLIGFHGAGGGGSMASMDAALRAGLQPANYVDTSGNPPASKVYRAARIILSIPGIRGYFLSGSGVASQEQHGLARAVLKAFREVRPTIPAVLRLGGNGEDLAAELVEKYAADLPAPVEAYQHRGTETQRHREQRRKPAQKQGRFHATLLFQDKNGPRHFRPRLFCRTSGAACR
jgi:succinyl-CoA synthetase beta subunit